MMCDGDEFEARGDLTLFYLEYRVVGESTNERLCLHLGIVRMPGFRSGRIMLRALARRAWVLTILGIA
jgi:hypothetical protein